MSKCQTDVWSPSYDMSQIARTRTMITVQRSPCRRVNHSTPLSDCIYSPEILMAVSLSVCLSACIVVVVYACTLAILRACTTAIIHAYAIAIIHVPWLWYMHAL